MNLNPASEFSATPPATPLGDAAASGTPSAGSASLPGDGSLPPAPPWFFKCDPGETPRAFGAFKVFFELGHDRSLPAVADQLGEHLSAVKKWSGRHRWFQRIADFEAGLLQQQAAARFAASRELAADWARRARECREQEWELAGKLRAAALCFLESFGDSQLEKMTIAQAARAVAVAARLARESLADAALPAPSGPAPIQLEIEAALKKAFAADPASAAGSALQVADHVQVADQDPANAHPARLN